MTIYQQIIDIVTLPPGNLAFHLVLAVAAAGALVHAHSLWKRKQFPQGRRMLLGLSLLLVLQVLQLVALTLTPAPSPTSAGQLILERTATLLAVLFILWLWVYPEPNPIVDRALIFFSTLVLLTGLLDYFLLAGRSLSPLAGTTWGQLWWTAAPLLALILGMTGLLIRRPNGYWYGTGMTLILGLGHILTLLVPPDIGTFPGAVRLAQLTAYPFLFFLPDRFSKTRPPALQPEQSLDNERRRQRSSVELPLLRLLVESIGELKRHFNPRVITQLTSRVMLADISLVIEGPDPKGKTSILAGFDLIREETFPSTDLESRNLPLLSTYIQRGKMLHLPASSTSRDLIHLSKILQLNNPGHLLAVPLNLRERKKPLGLVLMSPYSQRPWTQQDQDYLAELTELILQVMTGTEKTTRAEVEKLREKLKKISADLEGTVREKELLNRRLEDNQAALHRAQKELDRQDNFKADYLDLKEKYKLLEDREEHLSRLAFGEDAAEEQRNLQIALMEISELKAELSDTQGQLKALQEADVDTEEYSLSQVEALTSFAQRLRYPLHEMMDYTQEVFGQSEEMINSLENRLLLRLKDARQEIDAMLEEVLEGPDQALARIRHHPANLDSAITIALSNIQDRVQEKNIQTQVDNPEEVPPVDMDHYALLDILMMLIANAVRVTRPGGKILIQNMVYRASNQQHFAYLKIADHGQGVSTSELAPTGTSGGESISPETRQTAVIKNFSQVKERIEDEGGRIWIDSDPGIGTTVSLLLPFIPPPPST